jgi:WD40 repeat protein/energy-coupling factor transporter ATP-binding protein EcfA2
VPEPELDVFLSHATADKPVVEKLARILQKQGIKPWLDTWNLVPGEPWQEAIEDALVRCAACAVFFGPGGTGPWQNEEMRAAIERQVTGGGYPVIPVLLPDADRGERSRLPSFLTRRTWVEFRGTIEDERALRALIAGIHGIAPGPDPETAEVEVAKALAVGACPYRGLELFDVGDAVFFHGREVLTGWLLAKLQPTRLDQRFLAIAGPSGSGKSSLARAGLLASLKGGALPGSKDWPIVVCKPGPNPLESLALALVDALQLGSPASTGLRLMQDFRNDHRMLHINSRFALHGTPDRRLVVLIDQFEEVFTLCADEAQRQALISNLLYAAKEADGQTAVVLTLRSDFYGRCAAYPELASAVSDRGELVGLMTPEELRSAIEEPARTTGLELEGDLTDRLMEDVEGQPGYLPLLQHALRQLWQKREGNRLTAEAYRQIGGVAGALQQHAEEIFTGFDEGEREACRRVLLRLVQVDETRATRRRLAFDELVSAADSTADRQAATAVVAKLTDERLLTAEAAGEEKRPTVELAHEALISAWKRFQDWIDADREALRIRLRLEEAANEWSAGGRDPSYLYTGVRLAQAEEWAASRPGELTGSPRDLLAASAAQRDQERETRRRQRRRAIIALALAAVAAALMAATMFGFWKKAQGQRQVNLATEMAGQAKLALASNPLTGLLLAAEAVRLRDDLPMAKGALLGALALSDAQRLGRPGIQAVSPSSDHRSMMVVEKNGTATLWKLEPGAPPAPGPTFHIQGPVAALALSNDRRWLLVRDHEGDVRLLDLTKGDQGILLSQEDWRYGDPFSADSRWLTMDRVGTTVRYDLLHQTAKEMPGSRAAPTDVNAKILAMAPPGARIAALSSDERWLAWGEEGGAVRLQDRAFPELKPIELPGQGQRAGFLIFAAGDRRLVTQGGTEAPRLWDLQRYPQGVVLAATPDGGRLVVGRPGADVRVEGLGGTHPLQGVEPDVSIWAFSQDGSRLAAGGQSGKLFLWNLGGGDPNPQPISVPGPITALAFSPQGDRLAIGGEGFAKLWDLGNQAPRLVVDDLKNQKVTALAFGSSPDRLATGWQDGAIRDFLLDSDLSPLKNPPSDEATITALAFSPDGKWLATAYGNGKARLWQDDRPDKPLENQDPKVRILAFSPDGHWLAGGGETGFLQLWDRGNPSGVPVAWQGHAGPVHSLSFAKDGKELITTGQSVRSWPLDAGELIRRACDKAGRSLIQEEWDGHAPPGETFRKGRPCGAL